MAWTISGKDSCKPLQASLFACVNILMVCSCLRELLPQFTRLSASKSQSVEKGVAQSEVITAGALNGLPLLRALMTQLGFGWLFSSGGWGSSQLFTCRCVQIEEANRFVICLDLVDLQLHVQPRWARSLYIVTTGRHILGFLKHLELLNSYGISSSHM